jgi:hypothetical protein
LDKERLLPIDFYTNQPSNEQIRNPDDLELSPTFRNAFWHLVIEKTQKKAMWQIKDFKVQRSQRHAATYYDDRRDSRGTREFPDDQIHSSQGLGATVSKNTLSFILKPSGSDRYRSSYNVFYNFYLKNNRWEELKNTDILNLPTEKRWVFNDLLTKKVKAMRDEEIDCSNASAFLTQVENRFLLTKDGIDFCFDSKKGGSEFAIVSFSWAELEPYLKIRF